MRKMGRIIDSNSPLLLESSAPLLPHRTIWVSPSGDYAGALGKEEVHNARLPKPIENIEGYWYSLSLAGAY
jgi:hypothetical protein